MDHDYSLKTPQSSLFFVNFNILPIGIANSIWKHGDIKILNDVIFDTNIKKILPCNTSSCDTSSCNIFFNFTIDTNIEKRQLCYDIVSKYVKFIDNINNYFDYLSLLKTYKYCICPEGNGYDSHRIWECLYLNVIPICLKNNFTILLKEQFVVLPNFCK